MKGLFYLGIITTIVLQSTAVRADLGGVPLSEEGRSEAEKTAHGRYNDFQELKRRKKETRREEANRLETLARKDREKLEMERARRAYILERGPDRHDQEVARIERLRQQDRDKRERWMALKQSEYVRARDLLLQRLARWEIDAAEEYSARARAGDASRVWIPPPGSIPPASPKPRSHH